MWGKGGTEPKEIKQERILCDGECCGYHDKEDLYSIPTNRPVMPYKNVDDMIERDGTEYLYVCRVCARDGKY